MEAGTDADRNRFVRTDGSIVVTPPWSSRVGPYLLLALPLALLLLDSSVTLSAGFIVMFLILAAIFVMMIAGGFATRLALTPEGLQVRVPIRGRLNAEWGKVEQLVLRPLPSGGIKFEFTVRLVGSDPWAHKYSLALGIAEANVVALLLADFASAHGSKGVIDTR